MPELPEVETVVRDLRPRIIGRLIVTVAVGPQKLRRPWNADWEPRIVGTTPIGIRRRGKWILIDLDSGAVLLVHLGMTGQFTAVAATEDRPNHLHAVFSLDDGFELRYRDIRRFGSLEWIADAAVAEAAFGEKLGPEPVEIPAEPFADAIRGSRRNLKAILLDQSIIAGVGNIYADESLHRAKLHPQLLGCNLSRKQCDRLRMAIETVIAKAIVGRGSTIRDYVGGSGLKGEFQNEFAVYGRTGEPCPTCLKPIEMLRVAGRSSHFCPRCQRVN